MTKTWIYLKPIELVKFLNDLDMQGGKVISISMCRFWFKLHAFVVYEAPIDNEYEYP